MNVGSPVSEFVNLNTKAFVGFQVLMAVNTKMVVFWVVAPCRELLVEVLYQTTWHYNPEDSHLSAKAFVC
jgi:hypothetical protein